LRSFALIARGLERHHRAESDHETHGDRTGRMPQLAADRANFIDHPFDLYGFYGLTSAA
jgi:hypothetical protein